MNRPSLPFWLICSVMLVGCAAATAQQLPGNDVWGCAGLSVKGGGAFTAKACDRAGQPMSARTPGGSLEPGTFYIGGGSWDHRLGMLHTILIDAAGNRYVAEEDSVNALPRGHHFTNIGSVADVNSPEPTQCFSGKLAELLVFDRILAEDEQAAIETWLVQRHLHAGAPVEPLPPIAGLIVHLDAANYESDGDVWRDSSGHGKDATRHGQGVLLAASTTPAGGDAVTFTGEGWFTIGANATDFDADAHTWYVVFSVDNPGDAPLLSSAYANIARPLNDDGHRLHRLKYNNPGLVVDLGVGLWANPLPMDADGDGKPDLYIASTGRPDNGIYRFKPTTGRSGPMLFEPGEKVAWSIHNLRTSRTHDGKWVLMSPGRRYTDFTEQGLARWEVVDYEPTFYTGRANQWSLFDYDGDGVDDLIIGTDDWREYGWDDAFDTQGNWTNGPLRGFVWWVRNTGTNDAPIYAQAEQVMAGDAPVETYGNPAPNFADFNGDGLPDLICGEFLDKFTFYENVGTRTEPRYAPGRLLTHGGDVIRMELEMIVPAAVDWDGDGRVDLLVGQEDGTVSLLRNTGEVVDGMPQFELPRRFSQLADEVKIGVLCSPAPCDWDGDGDTDLVLGDTAGCVTLLENLGGNPVKWATPVKLEADGRTIRILAGDSGSIQGPAEAKWGYTVVDVADWNQDGLPDVLVNNIYGSILWYENIGTRAAPVLAAAQPVKVQWDGEPRYPAWNWWKPGPGAFVTQWRTSIHAIDLTNDGLLDLVAIDEDGYLALFERRRVNDELVIAPGWRIFHTTSSQDAVTDNNHRFMYFDLNADSVNDLAELDEQGCIPFYYRRIEFDGKTRDALIRFADRHDDSRYQAGDAATALRLTGGWAGRSGRRKFSLADWDGDGRLDLLVNSINVNFLKNVADKPGAFVFENLGPVDDKVLAGHSSCPAVGDLDGDGQIELIVGAEDGYIYTMPRSQ